MPTKNFSEAAHFFIYDSIKIFIFLMVITFLVSLIRSFFPIEKTKKLLSHKNRYVAHLLAALLGIITPFCSCSAIPLFLGFMEAGVPLGVTFSFLISSPMINEVALILLLGLFGIKVAFIYVLSGLLIAIVSGIVIGLLKSEKFVEKIFYSPSSHSARYFHGWRTRLIYAKDYTISIIKRIWFFILIGVGIGAWIHGYVPVDFLSKYASADEWYSVPLVTLIGIPLYSNAAGMIPVVKALTEKGMQIGTALAFMMAVTGLSFPEFMILRRVMKWRLIFIFAGVVGIGILFVGYTFNWLLG